MKKPPAMPDDREALDTLRRKLRFRAWHRGTREADLLIGSFADRHLHDSDGYASVAALVMALLSLLSPRANALRVSQLIES
jgi:hypothetical protein